MSRLARRNLQVLIAGQSGEWRSAEPGTLPGWIHALEAHIHRTVARDHHRGGGPSEWSNLARGQLNNSAALSSSYNSA